MKPKDMLPMFAAERLIRTEVSTLIGLMIQGEMNWTMPSPQVSQEYIDSCVVLGFVGHCAACLPCHRVDTRMDGEESSSRMIEWCRASWVILGKHKWVTHSWRAPKG
jgi:hypothetical protein